MMDTKSRDVWEAYEQLSRDQRRRAITHLWIGFTTRGSGWGELCAMCGSDPHPYREIWYERALKHLAFFFDLTWLDDSDKNLGFREEPTWFFSSHVDTLSKDRVLYVEPPFLERGVYVRFEDFKSRLRWSNLPYGQEPYEGRTLTEVDLSPAALANMEDGTRLFFGVREEEIDLSCMANARLRDAEAMFYDCRNLRTIDLSQLDTSRMRNMASMFAWCRELADPNWSKLDLMSAENLDGLFYMCKNLQAVDLSGKNASKVRSMRRTFSLSGTKAVDLSDIDLSSVQRLDELFAFCEYMESADLRGMTAPSATVLRELFRYCTDLSDLRLGGLYLPKATDISSMFDHCKSLRSLDLTGIVAPSITRTDNLFEDSGLESVKLGCLGGARPRLLRKMFCGCVSLVEVDLTGIDFSRAERLDEMFAGCQSLERVDLSSLDLSQVTSAKGMFSGCTSLGEIDLSGWDATNLGDTAGMFDDCLSLSRWTVSQTWPVRLKGAVPCPPRGFTTWWSEREDGWVTMDQIVERGPMADSFALTSPHQRACQDGLHVIRTLLVSYSGSEDTVRVPEGVERIEENAFRGCDKLRTVIVGRDVKSIGTRAFEGCTSLEKLTFADMRSSVRSIEDRAFMGCTSLKSILIPDSLQSMGDYVFEGCTSLELAHLPTVGGDGSGGYGVFDGCARLRTLRLGGVTFHAEKGDADYLSNVTMAASSHILDIREGVIEGFTPEARSAIYEWLADQGRHRERLYGCAVLPEGFDCTHYLGRCSRIAIIPADTYVRAIAPHAFAGLHNLVAFIPPKGLEEVGDGAFASAGKHFRGIGQLPFIDTGWW